MPEPHASFCRNRCHPADISDDTNRLQSNFVGLRAASILFFVRLVGHLFAFSAEPPIFWTNIFGQFIRDVGATVASAETMTTPEWLSVQRLIALNCVTTEILWAPIVMVATCPNIHNAPLYVISGAWLNGSLGHSSSPLVACVCGTLAVHPLWKNGTTIGCGSCCDTHYAPEQRPNVYRT